MKKSRSLLTDEPPKDLRFLLQLDINEFIDAAYHELLGRQPDKKGAEFFRRQLSYGLPREAVVYIIAESEEFGGRFLIRNMYAYRKIWKKHKRRKSIRKIPVIGWLYSMMANMYRMDSMIAELKFLNFQARHELTREKAAILESLDLKTKYITDLFVSRIEENSGQLSAAIHSRADLMASQIDNHVGNLKQHITVNSEHITQTVHDGNAQLGQELKYSMDTQRVIAEGLTPANGLESIQAELIGLLTDRNFETESYNQLPIEILTGYAEGKTVAAAHYAHLISDYAMAHNMTVIEPVGIDPTRLPGVCQGKETLIVSNPALSALILISPALLTEISRRLSRNLVLSVWASPCPLQAVWEGFSIVEKEEGKGFFRWAEGGRGLWRIRLFNALLRPVEAELKWSSEAFCGNGELIVSCCGETKKHELNSKVNFSLKVILRPGANNLEFNFFGPAKSPENSTDNRLLAFRVIDFSCYIDGVLTEQEPLYNGSPQLLNDDFIRRQLHKSGFFDVKAKAFSNHGFNITKLPDSQYNFPICTLYERGDYLIEKSETREFPKKAITLYSAYRLRRTECL
jgi:hypothetical protein